MEQGFAGIMYDSISLFDLFDEDRTPLSVQERHRVINDLYITAHQYNNQTLKLTADFFKGKLMNNRDAYETKMDWLEEVSHGFQKTGNGYMEAYTLREMWQSSYYSERYERSFMYIQRLSGLLDKLDDNYPYKGVYYIWAGIAYYRFNDYGKALYFLYKGLSYRKPAHISFAGNYLRAWNHLASYHHLHGNLDSAAYYNRTLLSSRESTVGLPAHLTFSISNLGRIEMEKGNYDLAIAMLEGGLTYMTGDHRDREFMAGVHAALGECYLKKGATERTKSHIDKGREAIKGFYEIDQYNRIRALHALESKYYSFLGQHDKAETYLDSALVTTSRHEQLTGQHFILQGKQELQETEILLKNERITRQKHIILFVILIGWMLLMTLLILLQQYRRKKRAYRSLAAQAKNWADSIRSLSLPDYKENQDTHYPDKEDIRLAETLYVYMQKNKPYKEFDLTLDILAERIGIGRNKLSRAINRTSGNNFKQYLNDFRIREAILLMSDPEFDKLSLDGLMEYAGFNSRSTFYETFKNITGLTPAQYRKSQNKNPDS
ncbi:MAG: helix-turn-helix domain-containing protein [Tannerellaceae bacterium]|nr:helix-turn-helix domain-containing protein [Tannerellaceae bacterium]